jgi:hypothetical protein
MPELRSGARRGLRSNKVDNVQAADPVGSPAVPTARGRAARRGGAAAGRVNKAAIKGIGRSSPEHRGKRLKAIDIDLQTDLRGKNLPEAVAVEAVICRAQEDHCLRKAVDRAARLRMDGDSADKFAAAEDDATTTPVPERVRLLFSDVFLILSLHGVSFDR